MTVDPFGEPAKSPLTEDELAGVVRWANEADFQNAWVAPTLLSLVAEVRFARRKLATVQKLFSESEAELRQLRDQSPTVVEMLGGPPVPLAQVKSGGDEKDGTPLGSGNRQGLG